MFPLRTSEAINSRQWKTDASIHMKQTLKQHNTVVSFRNNYYHHYTKPCWLLPLVVEYTIKQTHQEQQGASFSILKMSKTVLVLAALVTILLACMTEMCGASSCYNDNGKPYCDKSRCPKVKCKGMSYMFSLFNFLFIIRRIIPEKGPIFICQKICTLLE